jgi:8-oxo-dGTP diphosphatase
MSKISVRPSVIIIKENKLLVVHSTYNDEDFFLLPGGGIDDTETIYECAIREVKEETNQDVDIIKVVYLNDYIVDSGRCLNIYLLGKLKSNSEITHLKDPCISENKIKKAEWVELDKLLQLDFRPKKLIEKIKKDMPEFNNSDNFFRS